MTVRLNQDTETEDETMATIHKSDLDEKLKPTRLTVVAGPYTYTVRMSDEGTAEYAEITAADDDEASLVAAKHTREWIKGGEWGDEGASVSAHWTLYDGSRDELSAAEELDSGSVTVEIEPNHKRLMRLAGAPADCEHEFISTYEAEGGLRENPGVWSHGGTTMSFSAHCKHCGLMKREVCWGSQRNPGEHDTVRYEMPGEE